MTLLKFGKGNAKLDKQIATFSLPAGYTCPGAQACLARANRITGKVTDGPLQQFRCFQVTSEARSPQLRAMVWHNFTLLHAARTREAMYELIQASLPNTPIVRIHIGGDFYRPEYFGAWCDVARANPGVRFYAYTKEITTWLAMQSEIPANLILTASEGGKYDDQIGALKRAKVVFSEEQAQALGLDIDHDDSHAYDGDKSFALLLHGTQAKHSAAAKALSALKHAGVKHSYPRK